MAIKHGTLKFHARMADFHDAKANSHLHKLSQGGSLKTRSGHATMAEHHEHLAAQHVKAMNQLQANMGRKSGQDTAILGPRTVHPDARLPQTNSKNPSA